MDEPLLRKRVICGVPFDRAPRPAPLGAGRDPAQLLLRGSFGYVDRSRATADLNAFMQG